MPAQPGPVVAVSPTGNPLVVGPPGPQGPQGPPGPPGAGGSGTLTAYGADIAARSTPTLQFIQSISGQTGSLSDIVPLNVAGMQFAATATGAAIGQATAGVSQTPVNFVITPQWANASATAGHQTAGSLVVSLGAPVGSGSHAAFIVQEGGTTFFRLDAGTAHGGPSDPLVAFWMGAAAAAPTTTNWLFAWDPINLSMAFAAPATSSGAIEMTTAGNVTIFGGTTAGSIIAITANQASAAPAYVNIGADISPGGNTMNLGAAALTGNRHISVLNATSTLNVTPTQIPTGDYVTYIANANPPLPSSPPVNGALFYATGGALWVYQSNGSNFQIGASSGGTVTGVDVAGVDNAHAYVLSISGASGTGGAVAVGTASHTVTLQFPNATNQSLIEAGTQPLILNDGSNNLILNGVSSVQIQSGATPLAAFTGSGQPGLQVGTTPASFLVGWYSNTTTSVRGAALILQAQFSTNASSVGGDVAVQLQAGAGGEGRFFFSRSATYNGVFASLASMCAVPASGGAQFGLFGPSVSPTSTSYSLYIDSGVNTVLNGSGAVVLQNSTANILSATATQVQFFKPLAGGATGLGLLTQTVTATSGTVSVSTANAPYVYVNTALTGNLTIDFPGSMPAGTMWVVDTTGVNLNGFTLRCAFNASFKTLASGFAYLFIVTEANAALGVQLNI